MSEPFEGLLHGDEAVTILRKIIASAKAWGGTLTIEDGQVYLETGWVELTAEEIAFVQALAAAVVDTGEAQKCE